MSKPGAAARTPALSRKGQRAGATAATLALSVIDAETHAGIPTRATLRRWVLRALEADAQISLVFVGAQVGRRLNREYRGRDSATNVLTFAYEPMPNPRAPRAPILADIVLCVPVLRREAREQGKSLRAHLAHLVVHGVLHAQGYDHERNPDARRMQAVETRLLAELRIADPYAAPTVK